MPIHLLCRWTLAHKRCNRQNGKIQSRSTSYPHTHTHTQTNAQVYHQVWRWANVRPIAAYTQLKSQVCSLAYKSAATWCWYFRSEDPKWTLAYGYTPKMIALLIWSCVLLLFIYFIIYYWYYYYYYYKSLTPNIWTLQKVFFNIIGRLNENCPTATSGLFSKKIFGILV